MSGFNFEERCKNQITPLDPKKTLVEFLRHEPGIFVDILKKRENIYKDILETILSKKDIRRE